MEDSTQQTSSINLAGFVGLILGIGGFFTFGISSIPGLFFSIIGLTNKGHRIIPGISLLLCLVSLWPVVDFALLFFPPGVFPQPVQRIIYSPGIFWEEYDRPNLVTSEYYGSSFGGGSGYLYFKSNDPNTYTFDNVLQFAEKNGWVYHGKTELKTEFFTDKFKNGRLDWDKDIEDSVISFWGMYIEYFHRIPFQIQRNCTVLVFEAYKPHYIIMSSDGREMEVRIVTIHFPDPPLPIPDEFQK